MNLTRILQLLIFALLLVIIGYGVKTYWPKGPSTVESLIQEYDKLDPNSVPYSDGKELTDFVFIPVIGNPIRGSEIEEGKPLIVFNFNPGCAHCNLFAQSVSLRKGELQDCEIIATSRVDTISMRKFATDYRLNEIPNVHLCYDPKILMFNYFGNSQSPMVIIYGEDHQQKRVFTGDIDFDEVVSVLKPSKHGI